MVTVYLKHTFPPETLGKLQERGWSLSQVAIAIQSELPASISCTGVGDALYLHAKAPDEEAPAIQENPDAFFAQRIESYLCREILKNLGVVKFKASDETQTPASHKDAGAG